nr:hypothetical protein [Sphingomonas echinoides]
MFRGTHDAMFRICIENAATGRLGTRKGSGKDCASVLSPKRFHSRTHAEKISNEVDAKKFGRGRSDLVTGNRLEPGPVVEDGGVPDECVEPSECIGRTFDSESVAGPSRNIRSDRTHGGTVQIREGCEPILIDINGAHARSLADEAVNDPAPDTAASPGDHSHFPVEPHAHIRFLVARDGCEPVCGIEGRYAIFAQCDGAHR